MKTLLTFFILFCSSPIFAERIILYCSDIESGGYAADTKYTELKYYKDKRYKLELDLKTNSIISRDMYLENASCHYQRKIGKYVEHITCSESGYSFTLNLTNFKYTFMNGFGYAISSNDDLVIRYGKCERF